MRAEPAIKTSVSSGEELPGRIADLERVLEMRDAQICKYNEELKLQMVARENAEHVLQANQEQLAVALEAAEIGYWQTNRNTGATVRSLKHCRIFGEGETASPWSFDRLLERVHPDDFAWVRTSLAESEAKGGEWEVECRIRRADGAERHIWARRSQSGGRLLELVLDVTDRRRAELDAQRLAAIVDSSSDAIVGKDLKGIVTSWNAGAERLFGYRADEMIGTPVVRLIPPDHQEEESRILALIRKGERVEPMDVVRLTKDGRLIEISVTVSPIRDRTGHIVGASKVARDISVRRQAVRRMEWLASFPERNPNPIFEVDLRDDLLHYANAAALSRFPTLPDEALRHPLLAGAAEVAATLAAGADTVRREIEAGPLIVAQTITWHAAYGRLRFYCVDVTERRLAERALFEKEAELHAADRQLAEIVHGMQEACFALDASWRFTFVNDCTGTLLRRGVSEMLGRSIWQVFPGSVGTPFEQHYRRAMRERVSVTFEAFSPVAERWLEIRLFPSGEGIAAFLLDIHERKLAEEAVRASEERLQSLTNNLSEGLIIATPGDVLHWNRAAMALHDFADAAACPARREDFAEAFEISAPDGSPLVRDDWPLSLVLHGETLRDREFLIRHRRAGWQRIFSYSGALLQEAGGQTIAFVAIKDVTERTEAERQLRESEARFRQLADSMPDIVWTARPDGCVDYFNRRWYEYTGMPETVSGDSSWAPVLHPDDLTTCSETWHRCTSTGEPYRIEYRLRDHRTGEFRWQLGRALPVRDAQGTIVRWYGTCTDIHELRGTQDALQQAGQLLEQRVEERTAQLESANRELEAFSYSVSHDLRAPLRAVDGYSRIMMEDYEHCLDDEGRRVLRVVRSEARRMAQLVDELLNFSRLGRRAVDSGLVDMSALAREALAEAKAAAPNTNAEVVIGELPPAMGDRTLLRQVFVNLLSNALKFTRRTAAKIEVVAEHQAGEQVYVVRDNGAGFNMQYAGKLFGVFQRLHSEEEFEGTGVGLAIVQRIVQRHGGRIWAESSPGNGASFFFTLATREETSL